MSAVISRARVALIPLLLLTFGPVTIYAQAVDPFGGDDPFGGGAADPFGGADPSVPVGGDPFAVDPPAREQKAAPKVTISRQVVRHADRVGEGRVKKALGSATQMEFIETPLADIANYLGDLHQINVELDERALEEIGIGPDTLLTFQVKDISLRSALQLLLQYPELEFVVADGVLRITSLEEAECSLVTKVYSIRHLLPVDSLEDDPYAGDEIVDLLTAAIRPTTWEDVGGAGSVAPLRRSLVISTTPEIHDEVADLLKTLRQAKGIVAASTAKPPQIASLPAPPAWRTRINKALAEKIDCDFREAPLQDVIDVFSEQVKVSILIDHRALEDVGIGSDTPITRSIKGVSLSSALRLILKEMDLTYVIRHEVVLITTPEECESFLQTRIFPVADLILPWREEDEWLEDVSLEYGADYDSLIDLITSTVRPDMWENVGGPGAIEPWHGCLVLAQTDDVFAEIESLLAGLRKLHAQVRTDPKRELTEPLRLDEFTSPCYAKLREALWGEVGMLAFNKSRLDDLLAQMADKHDVPIQIDLRALEDVGIDGSLTVTATLGGESVSQALERLLRPFELKFVLRDEAVLVTTPEEAESELLTWIYPVADLVLPEASDGNMDDTGTADFDPLIDTITATVRADSWEEVGGPGAVEPYPFALGLVVSTTEDVHQEVADLLAELRKMEAAARAKEQPVADEEAAAEEIIRNHQGERLYLKVYRVSTVVFDESGNATVGKNKNIGELAEVIRELVEPESWKSDEGYYLRAIGGKEGAFAASLIVVRHTAATHRKIHKLLTELDALPQFGGGLGSGGISAGGVFDVPDHVLPQFCAVGFGINGGLGYSWSGCGNGIRTSYSPTVTLREFSLRAAGDRSAMPLRIYDQRLVEREDVQKTIAELIAPGEWETDGRYLRAIKGKLIVRQTPQVHRKVYRLMIELGAMSPPRRGSSGWGCGSVIPVVGERALGETRR